MLIYTPINKNKFKDIYIKISLYICIFTPNVSYSKDGGAVEHFSNERLLSLQHAANLTAEHSKSRINKTYKKLLVSGALLI
jgi:hypothetical protein